MTMLGVYRPGTSILHRLAPGPKLLSFTVAVVAITLLVRSVSALGVAVIPVVATFAVARIGPRDIWRQFKPMLWLLGFLFVFQSLLVGWERALVVCGVIALSVALAAVITLTTRTTAMIDTLVRVLEPLRRFGVRTDLVALTLALTIRCIPLMVEVVREVNEARLARGLRPSPRVLVAPIVLAALRTADGFAETLTARGMD